MGVERYGSKTDVVVKLVLVFFIALLSFSIGTFVGKKFSDNQHNLAQLDPAHDKGAGEHGEESRSVASVHPEAGEVKPEKALTDDEIAKLAEEFVTDEDKTSAPTKVDDTHVADHTQAKNDAHAAPAHGAQAHGTPAPAATAAAPASGHAPAAAAAHGTPTPKKGATARPETLKPAARMAEGQTPVVDNPPAKVSRIPSALPKEVASSAIGKYTVQVAAYQDEKEAQTMSADLKAKGFSAFYVAAQVKGKTWYRVSVGLFTTVKEADTYKKDLIARAKVASAIVQKITSAD